MPSPAWALLHLLQTGDGEEPLRALSTVPGLLSSTQHSWTSLNSRPSVQRGSIRAFPAIQENKSGFMSKNAVWSQLWNSLLGDPVSQGGGGRFVSSWNKLKYICLSFGRSPAQQESQARPHSSVPSAKTICRKKHVPGLGTLW